jgi:hypothetical protein
MIMKNDSALIFYLNEKSVCTCSDKHTPQTTLYTPSERLTELDYKLLAPYELARWETK